MKFLIGFIFLGRIRDIVFIFFWICGGYFGVFVGYYVCYKGLDVKG